MSRKTGEHNIRDNPCFKEHNLSNNCLWENNFDRDKCYAYFENYKACMRFWSTIQIERHRKGIVPDMPDYEERQRMKQEHLSHTAQKS